MAGIRLHVIAPLVVVAVGKCARDPSVYVRKCAANALPKLHDLRLEEYTASIEELIGILLNDHSPCVIGAAAAAFSSICPNNLSLIGRNYRSLCEILPDVEEWGQIVLIGILLRYVIARHGFVQESIMFSLHRLENSKAQKDLSDSNSVLEDTSGRSGIHVSELANVVFRCYMEGPDEYLSRVGVMSKELSEFNTHFTTGNNNDDVKFLLRCTSPLLWSNNSAVVLAAAGVHWIMSPLEDVRKIVKPLLFVQRSSAASKYVVLCNIRVFAKAIPSLFSPNFEDFFICSSDSYQIKALKIDILAHIATDSSIPSILKEFQDYIRDPDRRFAADTVAGIGICAQRLPKMANTCVDFLLALTRQQIMTGEFGSVDGEANILIQAIISIKSIVQQDPASHEKVIIQLVRSLDSVKVPAARAMIVWMVGEYNSLGNIIPRMSTTVLKYLARCFTSEEVETKLQICNTTVKVLLDAEGNDWSTIQKVLSYVLELAKCDLSYDVRDRAYFLENLLLSYLDSQGPKEETNILSQNKDILRVLAKCLFRGQLKLVSPEPIDHRFYLPGSLSQIVLHAAPGYEPLPKPCTILTDDLETNEFGEGVTNGDSYVTDDQDSVSESLDDEFSSSYSSQHSNVSGSEEDGSAGEYDDNSNPLIQFTDVSNAHDVQNGASQSASDFGELLSNRALESWLDEQPGFSSSNNPEKIQAHRSSARISIGDIGGQVKPKIYTLLDPVNGNGLKIDYSFSSEISEISPLFICIEVSFKNCSNEIMLDIKLVDDVSSKGTDSGDHHAHESSMASQTNASSLASVEEIAFLESGQTITKTIQVRFNHHLLPLKLTLNGNGKRYPVKLRPDIGYFVRALSMDADDFTSKESHLRGMFECTRRCNFVDHIEDLDNKGDKSLVEDKFLLICRCLALKMLSNANLHLVSVDMPISAKLDDATGLCLRFSGKLLSTSAPCLITITVEGRCSEPLELTVKVNCEETVFGLNLLNRIVNFLVDPSQANV